MCVCLYICVRAYGGVKCVCVRERKSVCVCKCKKAHGLKITLPRSFLFPVSLPLSLSLCLSPSVPFSAYGRAQKETQELTSLKNDFVARLDLLGRDSSGL